MQKKKKKSNLSDRGGRIPMQFIAQKQKGKLAEIASDHTPEPAANHRAGYVRCKTSKTFPAVKRSHFYNVQNNTRVISTWLEQEEALSHSLRDTSSVNGTTQENAATFQMWRYPREASSWRLTGRQTGEYMQNASKRHMSLLPSGPWRGSWQEL